MFHIGSTRGPQDYKVIFTLFRLSQNLSGRIPFGNDGRHIEAVPRELFRCVLDYFVGFALQLFFQPDLRAHLLPRLPALVEPILLEAEVYPGGFDDMHERDFSRFSVEIGYQRTEGLLGRS